MIWAALLLFRAVTGGLLIGHGSQKLFGAFGGKGPESTGQAFEKIGLRPGRKWAEVGGAAEVTGGALTAVGLLSPVGPIIATAPMVVAWRKAHRDKPIWVNQGGAELPVTNLTIATGLILAGPGPASLDRLFGIRTPWWLSLLTMIATATGLAVALGDDIHEAAEKIRREEAVAAEPQAAEIPTVT